MTALWQYVEEDVDDDGPDPEESLLSGVQFKKGGHNGKCEICGKWGWLDPHHCIIHNVKGWELWLTVPENIEYLCRTCHRYPGGTTAHKAAFWNTQVDRGYDMQAWWEGLPHKLTVGRARPG
jgi:hypothetical protein